MHRRCTNHPSTHQPLCPARRPTRRQVSQFQLTRFGAKGGFEPPRYCYRQPLKLKSRTATESRPRRTEVGFLTAQPIQAERGCPSRWRCTTVARRGVPALELRRQRRGRRVARSTRPPLSPRDDPRQQLSHAARHRALADSARHARPRTGELLAPYASGGGDDLRLVPSSICQTFTRRNCQILDRR